MKKRVECIKCIEDIKDIEDMSDAEVVPLTPQQKVVEQILYDVWYTVAERIFERVCKVTELDEEQIRALREVALRPNDFQISLGNP